MATPPASCHGYSASSLVLPQSARALPRPPSVRQYSQKSTQVSLPTEEERAPTSPPPSAQPDGVIPGFDASRQSGPAVSEAPGVALSRFTFNAPAAQVLWYSGCVVQANTVVVWSGGREAARFSNVSDPELAGLMPELQRLFPGSRVSIERCGGREETELCAGVTAEVTGPRLSWAEAPKDAQLAHHLLFESYQRAAAIQAHCVKQMAAAAREMNNCFVDQLDGMQTRFQAAMERLDNIAFERKMMEHEATARHLSDHYRRLADDERRANAPSIAEQLACHLVAILNVLATGGTPPTQK